MITFELFLRRLYQTLMNQAVVYVYFNGGAQKLSSEQRRYANDMLLGLEAGVTVPFAFAKNLAAKHPFPEELQLAYLRLAAYHAFTTGAASEASRQGCMDHLGRWLQEQPPSTFATESLVMGALLSRATNGPWIADCAWESAAGPAWSHAKTTLPILEALHNIEWDERTWLNTLQALKPLFGELTAPSLNTLDLPTGWDFKV